MQEHNNFVKNALFPLKQCTARRYRTVRLTSRMIRAVTKLAHVCALTLRVDCITTVWLTARIHIAVRSVLWPMGILYRENLAS